MADPEPPATPTPPAPSSYKDLAASILERPDPTRKEVVIEYDHRGSLIAITTKMAADIVAGYLGGVSRGTVFWEMLRGRKHQVANQQTLEQQKTALFRQLAEHDIDPMLFDSILSNEVNRQLKIKFGVTFLVLTALFTAVSYAVVVFNGIFKWGISEVAITGLIIETPLQFVGLLYIIARNLFPQANDASHVPKVTVKKPATAKSKKQTKN